MTLDNVTQELRGALDKLRSEHSRLSGHISAIENLLRDLGAPAKRGPGRPKGSTNKRGPGRPPKSASASAPAAPKAPKAPKASASSSSSSGAGGRKRKSPNWSSEAREAARARMKAYWAQRRKNG